MSKVPKFRLGEEVTYAPNKHVDPVLLTYVETLKNGLNRFFSSQFPSLEYHLEQDNDNVRPCNERFEEDVQEIYLAFKGNDKNKQHAYEILLARRGPHADRK